MTDTRIEPIPRATLLTAGGLYLLLAAWMLWSRGFDFMTSDPAAYWAWSLDLIEQPFHNWWVPGYAIVLALLRGVTLSLLTPTLTMVLACFLFFLVGVQATYRLASAKGRESPERLALLYAIFPFVGLTYSIHPVSDSMALAVSMLACADFTQERYGRFSVWAALALMTHKAVWLLFGPLALLVLLYRPRVAPWVLLAGAPVTLYLALGGFRTGDALWFLRHSQHHHFASESRLPVLDGVLGTLTSQGTSGLVKGSLLLLVLIAGVMVLLRALRERDPLFAALGSFIVLLGLSLNQYEALALLRFAKVLVVPLALLPLASALIRAIEDRVAGPWIFRLTILLLYGTNLAAAVYLARFFS